MATLSVKITGDASDFQKAVSAAEKTLSSFDKKVGSIGKAVSNIGSKLSKYITTPAMTATSALVGLTLVKGFDRLKGIDEARAKLKGLGHDAESIEEIMNSALTSVKGTAYGLDEAATTAASAVAAGIKPGKELTRYLSLTADAAAIAGSSMSEMGSIFNKVQTSQVAYTEELEMLADRGVPIYAWIAEEAGVAQGAVKELASDGQISSELFLNAVEKNIGGAAKIMGESSFTAAVANINASLSRIGANFLDAGEQGGGFFSQVKPLLAELNEELGLVEDKAADLGVKFGKTFTNVVNKVKELKANFESLPQSIQKAAGFGAVFAVGLGPSLQVVGEGMETFSKVSSGVGKAFAGIKNSVNNIPTSFKTLGNSVGSIIGEFQKLNSGIKQPFTGFGKMIANSISNTSLFQKAMMSISGAISNVTTKFSKVKSVISGISSNAIESLNNKISALGTSISQKFPKITSAINKFGQGANTIFSKFSQQSKGALGKIGESITSLLGKVVSFAPTFAKGMSIAAGIGVLIAGMGLLQENFGGQINSLLTTAQTKGPELIFDFCNGIALALPNLITQGSTLITTLLNTITTLLPSIISGGMSIISALVSGLATNLPYLIPAAMNMIITLVTGLLDNLPQLITSGLQLLTGLVEGIVNSLPLLVAAIPKIISSIVITIGKNLPEILRTGIKLLVMIINGILQAIPDLIAAIPQVIDTIKDAFKDTDWGLIGKNLLNNIIDGIKSVLSNLWSTIKDIANGIADMLGFDVSGKASVSGESIPHNAHGTNHFKGGLTYINENNQGELVSLPNGSQIIPHDISVKYAQEAARSNTANGYTDLSGLGDYIIAAVVDTSRLYAQEIGKGISNMRMTVNSREAGRFISDLGFTRG